jgi:hypothetical protein
VPDGPEGDLYTVALSGMTSVVFSTEPAVPSHHVAFGVDPEAFSAVIERLRERGITLEMTRRPQRTERRRIRWAVWDASISPVPTDIFLK